jgi:hypothetical protein
LNVHDDGARQVSSDLGNPIRSRSMSRARHARNPAKPIHDVCDTLIVGGDDDRVHSASFCGAAAHVFDHGAAADVGKWFSGES